MGEYFFVFVRLSSDFGLELRKIETCSRSCARQVITFVPIIHLTFPKQSRHFKAERNPLAMLRCGYT
jgi:hypothetical protein